MLGLIVSGGQDGVINVIAPVGKSEPLFVLLGHTANVCALCVGGDGTVVSGSWDKTAKIWKDWNCVATLQGHSQAVWAVALLSSGQVLTGSADRSIKRWSGNKLVQTYTKHTDAVRGLTVLEDGFASCSNDALIYIWSLDGQVLKCLEGHTSFIYSIAELSSSVFASSGEDRSVRVWKHTKSSQTIVHPAISVWCVAFLPNGDLVSGASDGIVRVFSTSPERYASEAELLDYEATISQSTISQRTMDKVEGNKLPGPEILSKAGTKDGQVIMVKTVAGVEAHMWSAAAGEWTKVGDVVDTPAGSAGKKSFNGKEYDFVFDVDVSENAPPLKLPYNLTQNPYDAAQKFIDSNELPASYLDQVADFINKNTKGIELGSSGVPDPYCKSKLKTSN
jgi:phospholipase A-2-activating protein